MTRRGHFLFGLGVTVLTGLSIWISVALPVAGERQARAQVKHLLSQLQPPSHETCPLVSSGLSHSPYLKSVTVTRNPCAVTLRLGDSAPVERALRGATLNLAWGGTGSPARAWRCEAEGGNNANPADFPSNCHFSVQDPLL